MQRKAFHEEVAEKLIKQLKAGTAPWQKPWEPGLVGGMAVNPVTGNRYKGINAIHLASQGRSDSRWMTYRQAQSVGAQVRAKEKGTKIQKWIFEERRPKKDENGKPVLDENNRPVKVTVQLERPRLTFATVFNAEQVDGLPPVEQKEQVWNDIARAEQILKNSGASIFHSHSDRAFYRLSDDSIHLPNKDQFPKASNYYATALHELGHWTGHESRLNRDLAHPFGSVGYAKEELRAEIASMMLGNELGIGHDPGDHASYVSSWIRVLEEDPLEVFRAAADSEKILDHVLGFEQKLEQEIAQEHKQEGGMQVKHTNQQQRDQLLGAFSEQQAQAIARLANERRRLAVDETDAQTFEHTARLTLGVDLPSDWNGAIQVQGNVTIEQDGERFVEPANGRVPEFWGVYAQHENGTHQWIEDFDSLSQAEGLANKLELVDALSETNEYEQAAKLARVHESLVRFDPNSTDDDISAAKDARKDAELAVVSQELQEARPAFEKPVSGPEDGQLEAAQNAHQKPQDKQVERQYLNVPYKEKNEAKDLGAKWDRQERSWYIPSGVDPSPFNRWAGEKAEEAQPALDRAGETLPEGGSDAPETPERTYLAVPYNERKAAKSEGARWDNVAKSWYVGPNADMEKLQRWIPDNVPNQQGPAMSPREEFGEALQSLGCLVSGEHPIMDGKKHRIAVVGDRGKERAGFYVGHLDGRPAGYIKNNRTGVDMKWKSKGYTLTPEEKAKLQAEAAEKTQQRAAEQERQQNAAAARVANQTAKLSEPTAPTKYMENKGIQLHKGVYTDSDGLKTYIPAYDKTGKTWTMQYVQEDGTKRFAKESRKEGCFHVVGGLEALEKAPAIVISEGYATASTEAESLGFATVAAFDAGNLVKVAKDLHEKYPDKPIAILGDDDRHLELTQGINPGREKALEAARAVGGKAVFPTFAPGEADYPVGLPPITPENFRAHERARKALETAPDSEKPSLQKSLLSNDQLDALKRIKSHSDFNDLATKSVLGKAGVDRQITASVGKLVHEAEDKKIKQTQVQDRAKVQETKRAVRIS